MLADGTINKLNSSLDFFFNTIRCLEESNSQYCPKEGMFSVAQQVAHVAQTVDWFKEGMFTGHFNENFAELETVCPLAPSWEEYLDTLLLELYPTIVPIIAVHWLSMLDC